MVGCGRVTHTAPLQVVLVCHPFLSGPLEQAMQVGSLLFCQ